VLADALRVAGHEPIPLVWGREVPPGATVVVRSPWDYVDRPDDFRRWLDELDRQDAVVHNPTALVRWNLHKSYLVDLAGRGVATVPTIVLPAGHRVAIGELPWPDLVVKPAVGASARMTVHTGRMGAQAAQQHIDRLLDSEDAVVQPYLPSIADDGELSVVVIDGRPTHAVAKRPAPGDWRVQRELGGSETAVPITAELATAAATTIAAVGPVPSYGRVDLVRGDDGQLLLIEVELIEPELWFDLAPAAATALAAVVTRGDGSYQSTCDSMSSAKRPGSSPSSSTSTS
jgi:glutathione synthase/RimK-type ligase-like ATP-grasp enzyme